MNAKSMSTVEICRLCAKIIDETDSSNLFDKKNAFLIQQIKELTGIKLKKMERKIFPCYICSNCKNELPRAYEFRRIIIKAQEYFQSNDYKIIYEAAQEDDGHKPAFAFIPLNKYAMNSADEVKSFSNNFNEGENNDTQTEFVSNCQNTRKYKCRKKESKLQRQIIKLRKSNPTNPTLKDECAGVPDSPENERSPESSFEDPNCYSKKFLDNIFTDSFSDEDAESCIDSENANLVKNLRKIKPASEQPHNFVNKPDVIRNRKFSCYLCQHPIKSLNCLKIHFRKRHKGEKFQCDLCEEKLPTIKTLERHFRIQHQGEKEFKCHYCDMFFKYSTIRCRHERRMHSKDPPFLCCICGKTFITTTMGRDHMTVHTKERAFHCAICKAGFLRKSHLNTHYRSMTHKNNEHKLKEVVERSI